MQLHTGAFFNDVKAKISQHIKIEIDYYISMAPETVVIKINTNCQMQQSDKTNKSSTNHNHFSEVKTSSGEVIELSEMEKENWDKTS